MIVDARAEARSEEKSSSGDASLLVRKDSLISQDINLQLISENYLV